MIYQRSCFCLLFKNIIPQGDWNFSLTAPSPVVLNCGDSCEQFCPLAHSKTTLMCQHIKQPLWNAMTALIPCFGACWTRLRGIALPHPVVCPLGCKESESLIAHQAFPPGGPGTGRGRLTNCKGFNWAAHKLFSLHKGIGFNKCHKPIMR